MNPERQQFFWMGTAPGEFGKSREDSLDLVQNVVRFLRRIVQSNIVIKLIEITYCIIRQENSERHQCAPCRSRRRLITSSAGWTLPSPI